MPVDIDVALHTVVICIRKNINKLYSTVDVLVGVVLVLVGSIASTDFWFDPYNQACNGQK